MVLVVLFSFSPASATVRVAVSTAVVGSLEHRSNDRRGCCRAGRRWSSGLKSSHFLAFTIFDLDRGLPFVIRDRVVWSCGFATRWFVSLFSMFRIFQ